MNKHLLALGLIASVALFGGWKLPKIKNPIDSVSESIGSTFSSDDDEDATIDAGFSGDYAKEVKMIDKKVRKGADGRDGLLLLMEQGAIYRAASGAEVPLPNEEVAGDLEDITPQRYFLTRSIKALDLAEAKVNEFEAGGNIRVGQEGVAMITNQARRDYTGRFYDKVMINTYKALNYMALGDFDAARVELNRSLQRQRDAVEANAKQIEAAQESEEEEYDVDRARQDASTNAALAEIEAEVDSRILAYGDYVNPFAVFLDGLFFMHTAQDGSDLERARKSLERVVGMVPDNTYIREDLEFAEAGKARNNVTYVIFETGRAPSREEKKIEIPTFLVTSDVSYVGAAFPKLNYYDNFDQTLSASVEGETFKSASLSSMDSVVSQDFKNDWPAVVRKTMTSTVTKTAADATIQNVASNSFGFAGQLVTKVTTAGVQSKLNEADTRTWETLPKEFQYLCVPTPASGLLVLSSGSISKSVPVIPGQVNVVHVKSDAKDSPLLVTQFTFSPSLQ